MGREAAVSATWIAYNPTSTQKRKDVRVHAAKASAATRKATIASKEARGRQQVKSKATRLATELWHAVNAPATTAAVSQAPDADANVIRTVSTAAEEEEPFEKLLVLVTQLHDGGIRDLRRYGERSLAYTSIRTTMWEAMTGSTTLFQVAIFVAGTHSNTCGLPRTALQHMGPGLVALRGASLDAIQAAITAVDVESITPLAIALLAGWERRFGDAESYQVHMRAWKKLPLPTQALEENNLSTLTDLTLEIYRAGLDERSVIDPGDSMARPGSDPYKRLAGLPVGFQPLEPRLPEARSLLAVVAFFANHDPGAEGALQRVRRVGLENLAWSPTHTRGVGAFQMYEDEMDQADLIALYHVRAACISLGGFLMQATMDAHGVKWLFDLRNALYIHAISCPHLRTNQLLGTKYQHLALWARFCICAVARDPSQDEYLRLWLQRLGVTTWKRLHAILSTFLYPEALCNPLCQSLYEQLSKAPDANSNAMLPTPDSLTSTTGA